MLTPGRIETAQQIIMAGRQMHNRQAFCELVAKILGQTSNSLCGKSCGACIQRNGKAALFGFNHQRDKLVNQRERHVVDRHKPAVFQRLHGCRKPRTGRAGQQNQFAFIILHHHSISATANLSDK